MGDRVTICTVPGLVFDAGLSSRTTTCKLSSSCSAGEVLEGRTQMTTVSWVVAGSWN